MVATLALPFHISPKTHKNGFVLLYLNILFKVTPPTGEQMVHGPSTLGAPEAKLGTKVRTTLKWVRFVITLFSATKFCSNFAIETFRRK